MTQETVKKSAISPQQDVSRSIFQSLLPGDCTIKTVHAGEHVCHQGQSSNKLYLLKNGLLKSSIITLNGQDFIMGFYLPSDLFGWEGFDKPNRGVSVIALTDAIIYVIDKEKIFTLTQKNTQLSNQILHLISRRIHHDNIALLRTTAKQRVATFLLQLTARYRELGYAHDHCQLLMSYQDIANYLRINPSTISRVLHQFQTNNIIAIEKHIVYLKNIAELRTLSEI